MHLKQSVEAVKTDWKRLQGKRKKREESKIKTDHFRLLVKIR